MADLIFNEEALLNGNIFQFEQRLQSQLNRYTENGFILTTYFNQDVNASTADRGMGDADQWFGDHSPFRFHCIKNLPMSGFAQANPDNTDEQQIEDITVEGDAQILPGTIVPKDYDCFIVNHLKMDALFQITNVTYDSMKTVGFYKVHYRLMSTSKETIDQIYKQCIKTYYTELDAIGTSINPVIEEEDFIHKRKLEKVIDEMIHTYRVMYYSDRHNCFLYTDHNNRRLFDAYANAFMGNYSLMNNRGYKVIVLGDKLRDAKFPVIYLHSVYHWLEKDAPLEQLQKFPYQLVSSNGYPASSFVGWNEEVEILQPMKLGEKPYGDDNTFFNEAQFEALSNPHDIPNAPWEALMWNFIHRSHDVKLTEISTNVVNLLEMDGIDPYLYTPIVIYILRKFLGAI